MRGLPSLLPVPLLFAPPPPRVRSGSRLSPVEPPREVLCVSPVRVHVDLCAHGGRPGHCLGHVWGVAFTFLIEDCCCLVGPKQPASQPPPLLPWPRLPDGTFLSCAPTPSPPSPWGDLPRLLVPLSPPSGCRTAPSPWVCARCSVSPDEEEEGDWD